MDVKLSEGAIEVMMGGGEYTDPILQITAIKKIQSGTTNKDRYRLVVSDGRHSVSHAMLTAQNNEAVVQGGINTVIKVKRFITSAFNTNSSAKEQRLLLLLDVDVLVSGNTMTQQIGNPVPLNEAKKAEGTGNLGSTQKTETGNSNSYATKRETTQNTPSFEGQMIHPILSLSPYQNRWVIKARVTNKSAIRTWSNSRGEGKLFSMDLVDETGEIRCTAFRDMVDKFYDYIQVDKVYYISKCQLKPANKQFSSLKNDYEMTVGPETIIQECMEDDSAIPTTKYDFTTIDKIANMVVGAIVDVCAICKDASDVQTFQAKSTGRELKKREVYLVDHSKNSITLTLWGADAENFDGTNNPVVVVKGAKIGEFGGGRNLSCVSSSLMKINPDIPEGFNIRGWYDNEGCRANVVDLSAKSGGSTFNTPWMSFKEVKDQGLGGSDKGDYYQTVATVLLMRSENLTYKACPTESCNKKIVDLENGMYRCEKCNREYPNFKYRLLASINVADWSGNTWASMFTSEAEALLGMTAQEIGEQIENDSEAAGKIAEKANFKEFLFKFRVKMESYNDESRLKTIAIEIKPVNYKEYNVHLINGINQLMV